MERWTDRPLTFLAVLLLPLLLVPFVFEPSAQTDATLRNIDYGIWGVFAAALAISLILSPDRLSYLRRHWLDVLVIAVPLFGPLRSARVIQLLWAVAVAGRVLEGSRRLLVRRGTGFVLIGASFVVAMAAGLIVSVERDDPSSTIRSYGDGLWWAMTTFATVGYGDKYPVTAAGRGIAVALMLLGIAAFGVVTAKLAALFVEEQEDDAKLHLRSLDDRLRRIEHALLRPPKDKSALSILRRQRRGNDSEKSKLRRRLRKQVARGKQDPQAAKGLARLRKERAVVRAHRSEPASQRGVGLDLANQVAKRRDAEASNNGDSAGQASRITA